MYVFFDIDGTLLDYATAERNGALRFFRCRKDVFKISESQFLTDWTSLAKKYYQMYLNNELSFHEQRRARISTLYGQTGYRISDEEADHEFNQYLEFYTDSWKPFDDVLPCLEQLQKMDFGLGIISNGDYQHQIAKLDSMGISNFFTVIGTSGELGYSKPDRRIFTNTCNRVGVSPRDCVYVGDQIDIDVLGSTSAGMKSVWLNRYGKQTQDSNIIEINSLTLLPMILKNLKQ